MTTARPMADGMRHQQRHLHGQSRRFPGMEREVEKVEVGVRDRVLEQGDVAEENGCDSESGNDLRDDESQRARRRRRADAGARVGEAIRSRRAAASRVRTRRRTVSRKSNGEVKNGGSSVDA